MLAVKLSKQMEAELGKYAKARKKSQGACVKEAVQFYLKERSNDNRLPANKPFPFGSLSKYCTIVGDIISPTGEKWDADRD
jgi:hypothetical protein